MLILRVRMRRFVVVFLAILALGAGEAASADGPILQIVTLRGGGFSGIDPTFYVTYVISSCPGECVLKRGEPTARLNYRHKRVSAFVYRSRTHSHPSGYTLTGSFQVKPARVLCGYPRRPAPRAGIYTVVVSATVLGPYTNYRVSDSRPIRVSCKKRR
jgi:hypothetical protein